MTICFICLSALNCAAHTPSADKPHHTQSGFKNVDGYEENSFWDLLKWRRQRADKEIPGPESYHFPLAKNNPDFLKQNRDQNTVTWIGHATVLLQMEGYNILKESRLWDWHSKTCRRSILLSFPMIIMMRLMSKPL
jgi:hypothetical protein